jgi:hypothetical protein
VHEVISPPSPSAIRLFDVAQKNFPVEVGEYKVYTVPSAPVDLGEYAIAIEQGAGVTDVSRNIIEKHRYVFTNNPIGIYSGVNGELYRGSFVGHDSSINKEQPESKLQPYFWGYIK